MLYSNLMVDALAPTSSLAMRLAVALAAVGGVWLAVAWAL